MVKSKAKAEKEEKEEQETDENKAPVEIHSFGNVNLSVFENEVENKKGEKITLPSFLISKFYFDDDDKIQNTNSLRKRDLDDVKKCIDLYNMTQGKIRVDGKNLQLLAE